MSYAPITGTGTGAAPVVNLTWPFIKQSDVAATVNGAPVAITWTGPTQVTLPVVASGVAWSVYRYTSIETPAVEFTNGSVLQQSDLNTEVQQLQYSLQEARNSGLGGDVTLRQQLATSVGSTLVAWISAGTGAVVRWIQDKLRETVSILDFGGVGDGVTDNWAALNNAVAYCKLTGKKLYFPAGDYLVNTNSGTITLEYVKLIGEGVLDGAAVGTVNAGSQLWITGTTNSLFNIRRGTTIQGFGFYYPNQPDSAAPTTYPSTLVFDFSDGAVQFVKITNNAVYNAYEFCHIDNGSTGGVGHVEIVGNYISALSRGIYLRYNSEHVRIEDNNFTFGFWLAATEAGSRGYMRANATAVQVDQSDGLELIDNLFFGYLNGYLGGAQGLCQFQIIQHNNFDQTRYGVKATGAGNFDGQIEHNQFYCVNTQNTALQSRGVDIETAGTAQENISLDGNHFDMSTEDAVWISGNNPHRKVLVGINEYRGWASNKTAGGPFGALNISGALTNVIVTGGYFYGGQNAAYCDGIMGSPNVLQISGATFESCLAPLNVTTNTAILTGNVSFSTGGATSDVISATVIEQTGNLWDKPSLSSTKPAFLARANASQTFNSGTATTMLFANTVYDKGGNLSSSVFTAPRNGRYRFEWMLMHDATGTAGDRWQIGLTAAGNGGFNRSYLMVANYNSVSGSAELQMQSGQTVQLQVMRVGGAGNFVTYNDGNSNFFTGSFIE